MRWLQRGLWVCLLAMGLIVGLPSAAAHGAPVQRGIDARILVDDDGATGYAPDSCLPDPVPATCPGSSGAADLLSLDVREARDTEGKHVLWFRLSYQALADDVAGRAFDLSFSANGTTQSAHIATADGKTYTATRFDTVVGPIPVGDGHPKALDLRITAAALGIGSGAKLDTFAVVSLKDTTKGDAMPGTYYLNDQLAPEVPAAEEVDTGPGQYTLSGPAPLLVASGITMDSATSATFTLTADGKGLPQTLQIQSLGPAQVSVLPASLILQSAGTRGIQVTWSPHASGSASVLATSDLDGYALVRFDLPTPDHANATSPTGPPTLSGDPTTSDETEKSPHAAILVPTALAVALAVVRRRGA